ncbi:protein containing DUF876, bacterial [Candidatus Magnetomorum sp. HK-1]|nr:protein containing DUF876, bacterial [Candidatus Magnetomorum sp. HK-1]
MNDIDKCTARINWERGLYVTSQHFQFVEQRDVLNDQAIFNQFPFYWGISDFEYDKQSFNDDNTFCIEHALIYFKSGTRVRIPENAKTEPFHFKKLKKENNAIDVWVGIYKVKDNLSFYKENKEKLITSEKKTLEDENTGNKDVIELKYWNVKLILCARNDRSDVEKYEKSGYELLKIGEIIKKEDENLIEFNNPKFSDYIPPIISIKNSNTFLKSLKKMVDKCKHEQKELAKEKQYNPTDVIKHLQFQTVFTAFNVLNQLYKSKNIHPYTVYIELVRIFSEILSFNQSDIAIKEYDHDNLKDMMNQFSNLIDCISNWNDPPYKDFHFKHTNDKLLCNITKRALEKEFGDNFIIYLCVNKENCKEEENYHTIFKLAPEDKMEKLKNDGCSGIRRDVEEKHIQEELLPPMNSNQQIAYFKLSNDDENWNGLSEDNQLQLLIRKEDFKKNFSIKYKLDEIIKIVFMSVYKKKNYILKD